MSKGRETNAVVLGAEEEADRLWRRALEARELAADDLVALCESIDLGIRAVEILAIGRLQAAVDGFPATIGLLLDLPEPRVDPVRDAVEVPDALQFTDVLDLLSAEELDCVSPRLHRGWEDRRFSCRRARNTAATAVDVRLEEEERGRLLLLSAYRNRLFRIPPPVRVDPGEVLPALDELARLEERLREA